MSQNFVTQSEGTPSTGHSPLKLRHSVDFGVERGRLLGQEGREVEFIIRLSLLLQAGFLFFLFPFSFFLWGGWSLCGQSNEGVGDMTWLILHQDCFCFCIFLPVFWRVFFSSCSLFFFALSFSRLGAEISVLRADFMAGIRTVMATIWCTCLNCLRGSFYCGIAEEKLFKFYPFLLWIIFGYWEQFPRLIWLMINMNIIWES